VDVFVEDTLKGIDGGIISTPPILQASLEIVGQLACRKSACSLVPLRITRAVGKESRPAPGSIAVTHVRAACSKLTCDHVTEIDDGQLVPIKDNVFTVEIIVRVIKSVHRVEGTNELRKDALALLHRPPSDLFDGFNASSMHDVVITAGGGAHTKTRWDVLQIQMVDLDASPARPNAQQLHFGTLLLPLGE